MGPKTYLHQNIVGQGPPFQKMGTFGPPGAEKLIFADKTLVCLTDCGVHPNIYRCPRWLQLGDHLMTTW